MIGLLGRKKGMGAIYDVNGIQTPVTVIEAGPCPVVQTKPEDTKGRTSVQLGFESTGDKNMTKAKLGHLKKANQKPLRFLREFKDVDGNPDVGDILKVDVFNPGDLVDITGISKGRGFTGVIKRYGFNQPPMTHGTHESYRGGGSIGAASYPARVWPGLKMAGRMGGENVTVKNLTVIKIDLEKGLLVVKGAVPGAAGDLVVIRKND